MLQFKWYRSPNALFFKYRTARPQLVIYSAFDHTFISHTATMRHCLLRKFLHSSLSESQDAEVNLFSFTITLYKHPTVVCSLSGLVLASVNTKCLVLLHIVHTCFLLPICHRTMGNLRPWTLCHVHVWLELCGGYECKGVQGEVGRRGLGACG